MRRGWILGLLLWAAALAGAQAPDPKARLEALAVEMRDLAADKQVKQTAKLFEAAAAIHELGEDAKAAWWGRRIYRDATPAELALEDAVALLGGDLAKAPALHKALGDQSTVILGWRMVDADAAVAVWRQRATANGPLASSFREPVIALDFLAPAADLGVEAWRAATPDLREKLWAILAAQPKSAPNMAMYLRFPREMYEPVLSKRLFKAEKIDEAEWDLLLRVVPAGPARNRFGQTVAQEAGKTFQEYWAKLTAKDQTSGGKVISLEAATRLAEAGQVGEALKLMREAEPTLKDTALRDWRLRLASIALVEEKRDATGQARWYADETKRREEAAKGGDVEALLALGDTRLVWPNGGTRPWAPDAAEAYAAAFEKVTDKAQAWRIWMLIKATDQARACALAERAVVPGAAPAEAMAVAVMEAAQQADDVATWARCMGKLLDQPTVLVRAMAATAGWLTEDAALVERALGQTANADLVQVLRALYRLPSAELRLPGGEPLRVNGDWVRPRQKRAPMWAMLTTRLLGALPNVQEAEVVSGAYAAALTFQPSAADAANTKLRGDLRAAVLDWAAKHPQADASVLLRCAQAAAHTSDAAPLLLAWLDTAKARGTDEATLSRQLETALTACRLRSPSYGEWVRLLKAVAARTPVPKAFSAGL